MVLCHTGNIVTHGRYAYKSAIVTYENIKEYADKGCTLLQIVRNLKATEHYVRKIFKEHPEGVSLRIQVANNSKTNPYRNRQ